MNAYRREIGFAAREYGRGEGREARRATRTAGAASRGSSPEARCATKATGAAYRGALRAREGRAAFTSALGTVVVVSDAAARADCRRLLVRHRRPSDVDGQR